MATENGINAEKRVEIIGAGSFVPEKVLTNEDLEKIVDTSDEWIIQRTGIRERRILEEGKSTSYMAIRAAEAAIAHAGIDKNEIDLIISGTQTRDYPVIAVSAQVQDSLGIQAAGFDIIAGCTGFVVSLDTAWQFLRSGKHRTALVIGAEALSRITNYKDRTTCVLFGDAAGAVILRAFDYDGELPGKAEHGSPGRLLHSTAGLAGDGVRHLLIPAGGSAKALDPESLEKGEQYLYMEGNAIYKFVVRKMRGSIVAEMKFNSWTGADLDLVIPHQVNIRIIEAAIDRLDIPPEKVYVNIERFGNTSTASVPLAFAEAIGLGRVKKGDRLIMTAFGAGLTWGSISMIY